MNSGLLTLAKRLRLVSVVVGGLDTSIAKRVVVDEGVAVAAGQHLG